MKALQGTEPRDWLRRGDMRRDTLASVIIAAFMLVIERLARRRCSHRALRIRVRQRSLRRSQAQASPSAHSRADPDGAAAGDQGEGAGVQTGADSVSRRRAAHLPGSWVGIPAAQARLEFHKSAKQITNRWIGEIWIETNAFADLFYKMRDYMRESMADDTLHTSGIYLVQHEKSRLNYYDVTIDRPTQTGHDDQEKSQGHAEQGVHRVRSVGPDLGRDDGADAGFRAGQDLRVRRVQRQPALRLRVRGR